MLPTVLRLRDKFVPLATQPTSVADGKRLHGWTRLLVLSVAILLITGQVAIWGVGIAGSGGPEVYVRGKTDLIAVLTGGLMIRAGEGNLLYDLVAQHEYQKRVLAPYLALNSDRTLPNSHPPFETLLIAPLMDLPYSVIFGACTLLELAALAAALWLLVTALPVERTRRWAMIALACACYPVHAMLWLGQSSSLLLLGLCGVYAALKHRRDTWAGVALALLAIKPQLALPIIVLLLVQRCWKPLVVAGSILTGLSLAVMPLIGVAWPLRYLAFLASVRNWSGNLGEHPELMYNWRGFAIHVVGAWSPGLITPVFGGLTVASACLMLWIGWCGHRSSSAPIRVGTFAPEFDLLWALVGLMAILLPVHLYLHDFTLLILPGWILGAYATSGGWTVTYSRVWITLLWSGFALALLGFFLIERPAVGIVLNVGLVAVAIGILAWRLVIMRSPSALLPLDAASADPW